MDKGRFKLTLSNTPENLEFLDFFKKWHDAIPTIYFMDICCISNIKKKDKYLSEDNTDVSKFNFLKDLEEIDLSHNAISCLPSIIEKVSDFYNDKSTDELKEEIKRDINALNGFFKKARVIEVPEFIEMYVDAMKNQHPESSGKNYHDYLFFLNGLGLANTLPAKKKIEFSQVILDKADELDIDKFSVIVVTAIACLYGCIPAKRVMKFKAKEEEFNSSNALADIQTVSRVGRLSHDMECQYHLGKAPYARSIFLTDDKYLKKLYDYFFVNNVLKENSPTGVNSRLKVTIEGKFLFPDLFKIDESGELKEIGADEPETFSEYERLLIMMGVKL